MYKRMAYIVLIVITAGFILIAVTSCAPLQETSALPANVDSTTEAGAIQQLQDAQVRGGVEAQEILLDLAVRADAIGYAANLALADKLLAQQADAEAYLRRALALYDTESVRDKLAKHLGEKGDHGAAVVEYLALLPDRDAVAMLQKLNAGTDRIVTALAAGAHWQSAAELLEASAKEQGLDNLSANLRKYYAQSLVELGRYEEAQPVLQVLLEELPEDLTVRWQMARVLEAANDTERAMELYSQSGPAGAYHLGRLYEQLDEPLQAVAAYQNSGEPAALWRGAVLLDEADDRKGAIALYRMLSEQPGRYQDDAAYRAYLLSSLDGETHEELMTILTASPAWMVRLGYEPVWVEVPDPESGTAAILQRLDAYKAAGRDDLTEVELAIAWENSPVEDIVLLGEWFLSSGNMQQSVRWGARVLRELPAQRAYLLAYPRPFVEHVEGAAAEFNLEPELIWAVMREESRYRADVVSRVGAVGLMQIMPATGREIARSLKTDFQERNLYDPAVNIRFGAYYLRTMLNRFDGEMDKMLAAYNGGSGNVRRWSRSRLGQTPTGFPTAVTFLETREYITKVRNTYLVYKWLYGE